MYVASAVALLRDAKDFLISFNEHLDEHGFEESIQDAMLLCEENELDIANEFVSLFGGTLIGRVLFSLFI